MPLEDFFTQTEMKDGLTALARVKELVSVMQKTDYDTKNLGDAARQWSTVANILVATKNIDCFSYFIQLDGLHFLNEWIQVAQSCSDKNDSSVEASISTLLEALEKLPIEIEQPTASSIGATVKHLFDHKSSKIQERARALFDHWNRMGDKDAKQDKVDEEGTCCEDDPKPPSDEKMTAEDVCLTPAVDGSVSRENTDAKIAAEGGCSTPVTDVSSKGSADEETARSDVRNSNAASTLNASQGEATKEVENSTANLEVPPTTSNSGDVNEFQGDTKPAGSSSVANMAKESLSATEQSSINPLEAITSSGACNYPILKKENVNDKSCGVSEMKDNADNNEEMEIEITLKEGSPYRPSKWETCAVSTSSVLDSLVDARTSGAEPDAACDIVESAESKSQLTKTASADLGGGTQHKSGVVDGEMPKHSGKEGDLKSAVQGGEPYAKGLMDFDSNGGSPRKPEALVTSFHKKEAEEPASKSKLKTRKRRDSVVTAAALMSFKGSSEAERRISEMEFEYGEDDALEVARLVAREVEREVVDYREPFCSSSPERSLEDRSTQPSSPDSVEGKPDEEMMEQLDENKNEMPNEQGSSGVGSSPKLKRPRISNSSDTEPECQAQQGSESPHSVVAQESTHQIDKGKCNFDLNEDICTEETRSPLVPISHQSNTLSAPVAVIATSKGASGLPTTPLHFEGELGWRGSAATSAFRPASPRKTSDGDKTSLVESSSNGLKPRHNFLEIDLNVAEDDNDDAVAGLVTVKHTPASSGLPSGDSSFEVSSRRVERLKLDLNQIGDNDDACPLPLSDWRSDERFHHHQNGNHSPSPASSSASRQPSVRDFDLNDNPSFFDTNGLVYYHHAHHKSSSQDTKAHESIKLDDPVVSIMGLGMTVDRKEYADQTRSFLVNGQGMESAMGANLARAGGGSSTHSALLTHASVPSHAIGYNGLTVGSTMSLYPQFCGPTGPFPYMVDSRGAAVIPQILTQPSSGTLPLTKPPFLMNVMGTQPGSNGFGVSPRALDLNSGMVSMDSESRDVATMRQLFGHGSLQPASTGTPLKRKEPECGWELNMFGHKQEMPWH